MVILCHSHNHHRLPILHTLHLQQLGFFVKHLHIRNGQGLRGLPCSIGNLMMRSKITKDGGCHSVGNGHDESNSIGTSGFVQLEQFFLGQQFGHHDGSIGTVSPQHILGQHHLFPQCNIRLGKNIHTTKGIQTTQLSQTRLRQRHSPLTPTLLIPLHILGRHIKITPPMHLLALLIIPKHHPTNITQYQILGRLHAHTTTSHYQHVQIL
mmetsp:Transcript_37635/g.67783  ORF Transcript_37635/g.67783 Transcript_37635/m.67783 type:complete len:209 (-) Transcript_37635:471-1097(-)